MIAIWLALLGLVIALQFTVIFIGPPYLRTLRRQRGIALDMLHLKPGQHLIDLGCGDGALLIAAAKRGLRATGYEINPLLVVIVWLRTRRYRGRVKVVWGNFWSKQLEPAEGIFVFLSDSYMAKFAPFLKNQKRLGKPKIASYAFALPGRKPIAEREAIFMYKF